MQKYHKKGIYARL